MIRLALLLWAASASSPDAPPLPAAPPVAAPAAPAEAVSPGDRFASSVVSLSITHQPWDPRRPWSKLAPRERRALAVVVEGPFLLTTAQMIADATLIEVRKLGQAREVEATVALADVDVDLALLRVADPGFFADLRPARLAPSTPAAGTVESVRWRGRQVEVGTSRVSRVEVRPALAETLDLAYLLVTTDLRGGGWSEPVFAGGRLVGLTVSQEEMSATVLPVEVIGRFHAMARATPYPGFARLGLTWMTNEDPHLAAYLGLPGKPRGVVVTAVECGGSADGVLRPRDVLLSLDGHPIDAGGYYRHPRFGHLLFPQIASEGHAAGDRVRLEVWRDGASLTLGLELVRATSFRPLVPRLREDRPPYLVAGGLVFRELDGEYLRSFGREWWKQAPLPLLLWDDLFGLEQRPERRRAIVLSDVLPHPYNVGYHDLGGSLVRAVNGRPVDTLADLDLAFAAAQDGFHRVLLHPGSGQNEVVLDASSFEAATESVLEAYGVPERRWLGPPVPPCRAPSPVTPGADRAGPGPPAPPGR